MAFPSIKILYLCIFGAMMIPNKSFKILYYKLLQLCLLILLCQSTSPWEGKLAFAADASSGRAVNYEKVERNRYLEVLDATLQKTKRYSGSWTLGHYQYFDERTQTGSG